MGIQDWSENVILVTLEPEPQLCDELRMVSQRLREKCEHSVVIDFSSVEIVSSSSLAQLLRLQKILKDVNQEMVLCGLSRRTMGIFKVTGLEDMFEFVEDTFVGLASLQMV